MRNRVEKAIEFIPCPTCGARPTQHCATKSGNEYKGTWFVHDPRLRPFQEEYEKGIRYGRSLGEIFPADSLEKALPATLKTGSKAGA